MSTLKIKVSIYLNYFVFAILLNSVGILIQKSINTYHVDELQASSLEAFKDLSIAFVSFFVGSFLPRLGYKKGCYYHSHWYLSDASECIGATHSHLSGFYLPAWVFLLPSLKFRSIH